MHACHMKEHINEPMKYDPPETVTIVMENPLLLLLSFSFDDFITHAFLHIPSNLDPFLMDLDSSI